MILLLGSILSVLIPYLIYRWILKGKAPADKKLYIKTFLLGATLYTLPIIGLELAWDALFKAGGAPTLWSSLAQAFLRAALLEEAVKMFFCCRVLKRHGELGLRESALLAGVVGIGYGFTEKLVYGTGLAMITNALYPGHMLFQWLMGYWLFRAFRAEGAEKRSLFLRAYLVPFFLHGFWDAALDMGSYLPETNVAFMLLDFGVTVALMILMPIAIGACAVRLKKPEE